MMTTSVLLRADGGFAEEVTARIRIAWGAGPQAPQAWSGVIDVPGATLTEMRPIGIEPDEAAALQLVDNKIEVAPMTRRAFDGCDVEVRGDAASQVTIRLRSASAEQRELSVPLGDLLARPFSAPIDELGGFLIIQRAPGDQLRVRLDRDHLVFSPNDLIKLTVEPSVASTAGDLTLSVQLHASAGGRVLWEQSTPVSSASAGTFGFEVPAPALEGAFRLSFILRGKEGFATKLTPWQSHAPLANRLVEFVVIDPEMKLPRITDARELVQAIDPANPKWWQRVPEWTQLDRLPVLVTPRALGNVKLEPRQVGASRFVELPAPAVGADLSWQAYPLAIREVGQPHIVELDLPTDSNQHLAISILEPDAAGRVMSFGREAGAYLDARQLSSVTAGDVLKHRLAFWPRTATPVLLVANQSTATPAAYGMIRVWRQGLEPVVTARLEKIDGEDAGALAAEAPTPERLVAAYISLPQFADCLGGAEVFDEGGKLSVKGWSAFLEAANRLSQQLKAAGYNAAVVSIAAQGSSIAPLDSLGSSPRYDTGMLSSTGTDLLPKDVLEALLRVFDREGLKVIPAIELAAPLPALERLRRNGKPQEQGIECVGADGRTWDAQFPGQSEAPHYNILNTDVQNEIATAIRQLLARYGQHESLGGVALQLSGRGYGVLPGVTWPLDDATTRRFGSATRVNLPADAADRFQKRAQLFAGPLKDQWLSWRQDELTRFYSALGDDVRASRGGRRLVLCTENLFSGSEAALELRRSLGSRAAIDEAAERIGIDLASLAAAPGVCALRPLRLGSYDSLESRALDILVNNAPELDRVAASQHSAGELHYHESRRLFLPSFDAQSPFGAGTTRIALNVSSYPVGVEARRPMATALALRDVAVLVEGGELLPLNLDDDAVRTRRLLQQLPPGEGEVRTECRQPVTLRVYRLADSTVVFMVNDSPWEASVEVPLESAEPIPWNDLGVQAETSGSSGVTAAGREAWKSSLPAYGVVARKFASPNLKVGPMVVLPSATAKAQLAASIKAIEDRMHGLDVERPYPQLHNPDFELGGASESLSGWQPRIGKSGRVEVTLADANGKALHLQSVDGLGVAAQSQRFPIPATGQLVVRARVRGTSPTGKAQMYVWIECDPSAGLPPRYVPLGEGALGSDWNVRDVSFDDLPLASSAQMKLQFHLVGEGEAWVDDVELFDLRFSYAQKGELAKRVLAARLALEEGQLVDCERLIDGYWPRYLVKNLPATPVTPIGPATPDVRIATRPDDAPRTQESKTLSFGERVRSMLK